MYRPGRGKTVASVQDASADGTWNCLQPPLELLGGGGFAGLDVDHDVADFGVGLQILAGDVDVFVGKHGVQSREYAWLVAVDMQQTVLAGMLGQRYLGEVDGAERRAVVAVLDELFGDFGPDVLLSLRRASPDVGGEQHIIHVAQRRDELLARFRLDREDVEGSASQMAGF